MRLTVWMVKGVRSLGNLANVVRITMLKHVASRTVTIAAILRMATNFGA